uniref:Uncharacterized protein n=1 Tax=Clytia hemisphaerica TaxID=252671 RepID=A0A7M5VA19_9CNID
MALNQDTVGGYDVELANGEENSVICPICLHVLREPMQAVDCGHRFCRTCVDQLVRNANGRYTCPEDRSVMTLFQDRGREREIMSLLVKCRNVRNGCHWSHELRHLETHQSECGYEETHCVITLCSKRVQRRLLEQHHSEECDYRLVICLYCSDEYMHYDEEEHITDCDRLPLCCDHCSVADIPRNEMETHLTNCMKVPRPCPFQPIGCEEKFVLEELPLHQERAKEKHIALMVPKLNEVHQTITTQTQLLVEQGQLINHQQIEITNLSVRMASYQADIGDQAMQIRQLENNNATKTQQIIAHRRRLVEQERKTALNERKLLEKEREINSLKTNQDNILTRLTSLERLSDRSSMKNTHFWRFPDFVAEWRHAYANGTCFQNRFVSLAGYKIEVQIEAQPDNSVSIFARTVKGAFDDSLPWPMNLEMFSCAVIDQNYQTQNNHAIGLADIQYAFRKPPHRNLSQGWPRFLRFADIQQYIHQDDQALIISIDLKFCE